MEWVIWFAVLVIANAAAWRAASAIARSRPDGLLSHVLRGIDDDVMVGGIIASLAAVLAGQIASGVPWLAQSWWTNTVAAAAASDNNWSSPTVVVAAILLLGPAILVWWFAPAVLVYSASGAYWRGVRWVAPRPGMRFIVRAFLLAACGLPLIVAAVCAVSTVIADYAFGICRRDGANLRVRPEKITASVSVGARGAAAERRQLGWDRISATDRDRCARSAAFHAILASGVLNLTVLPAFLNR